MDSNRAYNTFESVKEVRDYLNSMVSESVSSANKAEEEEQERKADNKNEIDVVYADLDEVSNIFEYIIMFTNDDNPKHNKTLKNLFDAVNNIKKKGNGPVPKVHLFIADEVTYEVGEDNSLTIWDSENEVKIKNENNTNTLVFSRLGVQGNDQCEHVVRMLQDRGFLILNPIKYSEVASNKYESAVLFQKGNIPQPRFCLMTKDILYDEELYEESMKQVYPDWSKDPDKNKEKDIVVKILDGHGGTGVALIDGKRIVAWLQMVFAIDPERQLLLQKREEADGGDIRVHVLTLRNKQVILAAMKRVKIGGDFRSNVSLGAEAEPVKLTPEQEQIALKTAKLSMLPWCAVDIMPLKPGSNPEIGDNVVLEINASPGTDGITDVIKHNFLNVMISELDDPKEFMLQVKNAGFVETIEIDFGKGPITMLAKLDTGNGATSHIEVGKIEEKDGKVKFSLQGEKYELDKIGESKAITGSEHHTRPIVKAKSLRLGQRLVDDCEVALVESRDKTTNALLNREILSYLGYAIDPNKTHILTTEMEKVKIV